MSCKECEHFSKCAYITPLGVLGDVGAIQEAVKSVLMRVTDRDEEEIERAYKEISREILSAIWGYVGWICKDFEG